MVREPDLVGLRKCTDFNPRLCNVSCVHRELHETGPEARHCNDVCEHNGKSPRCKIVRLVLK